MQQPNSAESRRERGGVTSSAWASHKSRNSNSACTAFVSQRKYGELAYHGEQKFSALGIGRLIQGNKRNPSRILCLLLCTPVQCCPFGNTCDLRKS
ncbi:hypothetical protein EVAR_6041_1 [Eumeta japonica]|uniref:Uncharacterized protein n=1 Tax=Eumeta variegata TaxID=151549 RepID=A0A4C1TAS4_EUMVA|nr:hypothetical protein EVAR_6041_1 [Eumeta japonica]